jgi:cytidyltransferase-like protein
MTHFIRLITTQHDNTAIANFAAAVATNTDTNLYESDDKYSYMDLAEYNTPEGNVVEIMLSEELSDDQLDKIVEQITLEDYEIQASLTEASNEKLVVIYPGRFHPFHKGHANVYRTLAQQYGSTADVYIATSGKQEPGRSPFSFEEKREMIATTGLDPNVVVRTKSPYQAEEITNQYDLNNTVVLYAISEKDMAEDPRFNFPTKGPNLKKDLQPAHMQQWNGWDNAKSLANHSYVTTVPTITFNVMGEPAKSATEIRQRFPNLSRDQQKTFINDLFGNYSDSVLNIMRNKLGDNNEHE